MANYNQGIVNVGDPGSAASGYHTRRLFNFSDRVADLAPDESPFFVYLSKVAKVPTDDPQFRFLEDRTKVSMTARSFLLKVEEMVFAIGQENSAVSDPVIVRVESSPIDEGTDTSFIGKTISGADASGTVDNAKCTVIGTSFAKGSGSPDVWSEELDSDYGYTQIFKTACEMSNTSRATRYRGYADEFQRIWNLKLREHKVDIERAMLFGQRASQGGILKFFTTLQEVTQALN